MLDDEASVVRYIPLCHSKLLHLVHKLAAQGLDHARLVAVEPGQGPEALPVGDARKRTVCADDLNASFGPTTFGKTHANSISPILLSGLGCSMKRPFRNRRPRSFVASPTGISLGFALARSSTAFLFGKPSPAITNFKLAL